jgi:DNA-binding transcriptional regulator WhiA
MSFSNDVKNELARLEIPKKCCEKAELLGLLKMSGALVLSGLNLGIHFSTENAALAQPGVATNQDELSGADGSSGNPVQEAEET